MDSHYDNFIVEKFVTNKNKEGHQGQKDVEEAPLPWSSLTVYPGCNILWYLVTGASQVVVDIDSGPFNKRGTNQKYQVGCN